MSGIAGTVSFGGAQDAGQIRAMLDVLAHRGPCGASAWAGEAVALGHLSSRPADADGFTPMPHVAGGLAITADVRLDNRPELLAELGVDAGLAAPLLILEAYRRWGARCPEHLLGDFAFAIWDSEAKLLFCARDHFGIKPFYYESEGGRFAFASEAAALIAGDRRPRQTNEFFIAEHLAGMVLDPAATIHAGVRRLPPAHSMIVSAEGPSLTQYWRVEQKRSLGEVDFPQRFRDLFTAAVECRTQGDQPVGAMLSGGLDSSSVACVAARIQLANGGPPLPTFSLVFDAAPHRSERPFIEEVLAQGLFEPTFINLEPSSIHNIEEMVRWQQAPYLAPGLTTSLSVYTAAARKGVTVLLDGHGGDEVVSYGRGRLFELAVSGSWLRLWLECRGLADNYNSSGASLFFRYVALHPKVRWIAHKFRRPLRARSSRRGGSAPGRRGVGQFLSLDFVARIGFRERFQEYAATAPHSAMSEDQFHLATVQSHLTPYAFEVLDKAAARMGVEIRYPFWDKRLVEFCVAVPPEEKLAGGWSRLILRRAMEGILPPAIQWRRGKLDFTEHLALGMLAHQRELLDRAILHESRLIEPFVDVAELRAAYARALQLQEKVDAIDLQGIWRSLVLWMWLKEREAANERLETAV